LEGCIITGSIDASIKVSKAYSREVLVNIDLDEPVWNFIEDHSKLYIPLLDRSKVITDYWKNPTMTDINGSHHQIIRVGDHLLASDISFNVIKDIPKDHVCEKVEAHFIGNFKGDLIAINNRKLLRRTSQGWLETSSPVEGGYTIFSA
jgi:hypothetical protein